MRDYDTPKRYTTSTFFIIPYLLGLFAIPSDILLSKLSPYIIQLTTIKLT